MKRKIAILLTVLCLLTAILPGCKSGGGESSDTGSDPQGTKESSAPAVEPSSEPLRVLIDVEFACSLVNPNVSVGMSSFLSNYKLSSGEKGEVEFEYLPPEGEERAAALTHMQTEIMTGKGPDLFICACTRPNMIEAEKALFQFPTQIMDRKLFLPLDDLIKEAEFTDFDKLAPIIMEQGRNEEGQQMIPLAFTTPVTVFRKSEVQHEHSKTMTLEDMLSGEDYLRVSTAMGIGPTSFLSTAFRDLADYENETLCFTEQELGEYFTQYDELTYSRDELEVPDHFSSDLYVEIIDSPGVETTYYDPNHHNGLTHKDEFTMVPMYSKDGGYVAYITSFAAINRNSKKQKEAFSLLDYLLSPYGARSTLYSYLTFDIGMPVNLDLGTKENPIASMGDNPWYFTEENHEEFLDLCENISAARFSTPLEYDIVKACADIEKSEYKKSIGEPYDEPEKILSDAYRVMEMELAES